MSTRTIMQGGAIVLVLLVALCTLSVGALGMMSAYSDLKLARTAAQRTEEYYELERLANEQLAALSENASVTFTVTYRDQHLTVSVLPGHTIVEWRQWQDGFDYETEGVTVWQG